MDWGNALAAMKAGTYDVIDTIFKTPERTAWIDFTRAYADLEVPIFFDKEITGITDVAALKGFSVAAKQGDSAVDLLRAGGIETIILFENYEKIIQAAKDRRVTVFVVDAPPALYLLHKYRISQEYRRSDPLQVGQFHRGVRKGDHALLQTIEKGFSMISSAEYRAIDRRWFGSLLGEDYVRRYGLFIVSLCGVIIAVIFWNILLRREVARHVVELNESAAFRKRVFESSPMPIVVLDAATYRCVDCNPAATQIYRFRSREETLGKTPLDVSDLVQYDGVASSIKAKMYIDSALRDGRVTFEWRHRRPDGEIWDAEVHLLSFGAHDKRFLQFTLQDITARKKAETDLSVYQCHLEEEVRTRTRELQRTQEDLARSEKMASLGVLAAGVAHEINNPLNYIFGGVQSLEQMFAEGKTPKGDEVSEMLVAMKEGVRRISSIVTSLNHYSRKESPIRVICDMHAIIDNCLVMLNNRIKYTITVTKEYAAESCAVLGDDARLHQAVLNILSNAVQSMESGGVIDVATKIHENTFVFSVRDSGCGIAPENIKKICDPFFTTKKPGEGTGLGLAITLSIIKEHGGTFDVVSELGKGTTVTVALPIGAKEA
jgi:PAS domain S-box-containing protein